LKRLRIGFQGEHGAFSEQAVFKHFGTGVETVPTRTIREVFNLTEVGAIDRGVVPVENSIEGSVNETYDALLTSRAKVVGEEVLRVVHCLIALPGAKLSGIRSIYSHPQALAQCRNFVTSLGADPLVTYDTAGSVKMIKEKHLTNAAAIAGERAAQIYGLKILAKGIEDYQRNFTRFFVISMEDVPKAKKSKTSIVFSLPHTPGSLYRALEAFATDDVNLTKIESRPTKEKPWEYYFFVDFEGHTSDRRPANVLAKLASRTAFLKVLGSYPRSKDELSR